MRVWKLKEEKTCEKYRCMVGDQVEEAKCKGLCVNDHWQQMKGIMMESAQDICGINTKNCSLSIVLTATDQKPQKSLKRSYYSASR